MKKQKICTVTIAYLSSANRNPIRFVQSAPHIRTSAQSVELVRAVLDNRYRPVATVASDLFADTHSIVSLRCTLLGFS